MINKKAEMESDLNNWAIVEICHFVFLYPDGFPSYSFLEFNSGKSDLSLINNTIELLVVKEVLWE